MYPNSAKIAKERISPSVPGRIWPTPPGFPRKNAYKAMPTPSKPLQELGRS